MEKISIIIPAYNEEKRIGGTLEEYGKFFSDLKRKKIIDSEILIVINNTKDRTEEIVKEYQKKYKIIRYLNFKQGGKGFAVRMGFKDALGREDNSLIGFVDADLSTSPSAYYDLITHMGNFEGIIASRYIHGAIVQPKQDLARIFVSRIGNFIIRALFLMPFRDTQCGAKLFRREPLKRINQNLTISQWALDIDLLYQARKLGFRVKEHPTIWADKEASKLNLKKASTQVLFAAVQLRLINSPFKSAINLLKPVIGKLWRGIK